MTRERIRYTVGNPNNPGDPWGRSELVIESDGRARLDQHTRGPHFAWTGVVSTTALESFSKALDEAQFPDMPRHPVPAGSAIRALTIGGQSAYIAWHASGSMRGYSVAFRILDQIVRELSQDMVKAVPASDEKLVAEVTRASLLTPGKAYLLAYLPARRIAHAAQLALVEQLAATTDPALKHAVDFSQCALEIAESMVAESEKKLVGVAADGGIWIAAKDVESWQAVLNAVRPHLTTPSLEAAWRAGESARLVAISVALAANLAYLRCAAPADEELRACAADRARGLRENVAALTENLLAIGQADSVANRVSLTRDLEPTTADGYRELNELGRDLEQSIEAYAPRLDAPG